MNFNDMQFNKLIYDSLNNLKLELKTTKNVSQFICCLKRFFIAVYLSFYTNEESFNKEISCFDGLEHYLTNFLSPEESSSHVSRVFPCIIDAALNFLKYQSHSIPKNKDSKEVLINNNLLASVLACHILCLVPSQEINSNKRNTSKTVENCVSFSDIPQNKQAHNNKLQNNRTSDDSNSKCPNTQQTCFNSSLILNNKDKQIDKRPKLLQTHYKNEHLCAPKSNKNSSFHSVFSNFYYKIVKNRDTRDCEKLKLIINYFHQLQASAEDHEEEVVIIFRNNKTTKEPSKPSPPPSLSSSLCPIIFTETPLSSNFASYCLLPSVYARTKHLDVMLFCVSCVLDCFGGDNMNSFEDNTNKKNEVIKNSLDNEKSSNRHVFGDRDGCIGVMDIKNERISIDDECCIKYSEEVEDCQYQCGSSFVFMGGFGGLNQDKECSINKDAFVKNGGGCSIINNSCRKCGVKNENINNFKSQICASCILSCENSRASNHCHGAMGENSQKHRINKPASLLMIPRCCIDDLNFYIEDINLSILFYLEHVYQKNSCKNIPSIRNASTICDDNGGNSSNNNNSNNCSEININEKAKNQESSKRKGFDRENCFNTENIRTKYKKGNRSNNSAKTTEFDQFITNDVMNNKKDKIFKGKRGLKKVVEYFGTKDELLDKHKTYCEHFYIQVFRDSMNQLFPTNDNYDICDMFPGYESITKDYVLDDKLDDCDDYEATNHCVNNEIVNRYKKDKEKIFFIDSDFNSNKKDDLTKNEANNTENMKSNKEKIEEYFDKEYNKERGLFEKMMQSKVEETEKFRNARRHFEEFLGRRSKRSNTFHSLEDVHDGGKGIMRVNTNRSKSNDAHFFKHKNFLNREYSEGYAGCYDGSEECYSCGDTNTDHILRHLCYDQTSNTSASGDGLNFASDFSEVDTSHSLSKDRDILKKKKDNKDNDEATCAIDPNEKNVHFVDTVMKKEVFGKSLDEIATSIASWFLSKKSSSMPLRTDYRDPYINYHNYATNFVFSVFSDVINELNTSEMKLVNNPNLELLANNMANELIKESKVVILDRLLSKNIANKNKEPDLISYVNCTQKDEENIKNQKNCIQINKRTKHRELKHEDWQLLELLLHWITASQYTQPAFTFVCCLPTKSETYLKEVQKVITFLETKCIKVNELKALLTQWFNQQYCTDLFSFILSS